MQKSLLLCRALALTGLLMLSLGSQAAPVDLIGRQIDVSSMPADTPQGREFRAGVQALLAGKLPAARTHFEATLKLDAKAVPARLGLAGVAQAEGRMAEVEQHLQEAQRLQPDSPDVYMAWGRLHAQRGQLAPAEKAFKAAATARPNALPPLLALGELYLGTPGRQQDALQALRTAATLAPTNANVQYRLGVAAATAGQRSDALAALKQAAALAPKDGAALQGLGRLQMEGGDLTQALASFDAGLKRQPASVPLMLDRAEALAKQGKVDLAVAQLEAAQRQAPKDGEVALRYGDVLQNAGRLAEAEPKYLKAITLAPKNPLPYNNVAWLTLVRKGDAKKAVEWARQAVQLSPRSSPLHDTLGWAQRAAGDLPAAAASVRKAIELEPQVAGFHFHLGVILSEQKLPARAALEQARKLGLPPAEAAEAAQLLKSLPPG